MRGLQANHKIDVDDFLAYVHDLPLGNYLTPDTAQREIIASLPTRNLIFTNADSSHAERVLTQLNLRDLFPVIIDVNAVTPHCKPMPESFEIAMKLAGRKRPIALCHDRRSDAHHPRRKRSGYVQHFIRRDSRKRRRKRESFRLE